MYENVTVIAGFLLPGNSVVEFNHRNTMQEKSPYPGEVTTKCVVSTPYKGNLLDNYDERVQGSTPPPGDNIEQQQLDIIQPLSNQT